MTLTDTAQSLLADIPPYEANEALVQRVFQAFANEIDRANAIAQAIRDGLMPGIATDTYQGLSMLETQLGIPVKPPGLTEADRNTAILAWLGARRGGTGAAWVALMELALGGTPWRYFEGPDDWQITIKIPYATGSFTALRIVAFARAITPAHIDIIAGFDEGFLMGISEVGVEPL